MKPFLLVAQREITTRIRKRSFLVMTILGPVLFIGLMVAPTLIAMSSEAEDLNLIVVDHSYVLPGTPSVEGAKLAYFDPKEVSQEQAIALVRERDDIDGLLYVPESVNSDPEFSLKNAKLYTETTAPLGMASELEGVLERFAYEGKLRHFGVDPALVTQAKSDAVIEAFELREEGSEASGTEIKTGIGFVSGILIYMFTFLYAAQIMRGVIEEKTSRIVEVLVTSVKPAQLMLGKILGIAAVGLLQFGIWIALTAAAASAVGAAGLLSPDPAQLEALGAAGQTPPELGELQSVLGTLDALNLPALIAMFLFYFLSGYLFYGALFAAVGAAVDSETDTQQFMLPLTLPLVLTFILSTSIIENPNGPVAVALSLIPFSAPIAMMIRLPFGVPWYELAASMSLMVLGFLGTVWVAARIYRIGILSYGKKPTYGDLWKWIRMKP
ncbi:MAG: ABC transporter permease [Cryomorphaceae bacterium]|nr:ABC transporter permease [Cryomorphaceae bacterium]